MLDLVTLYNQRKPGNALSKYQPAHSDTKQRVFLKAGNLNLNPPLSWKTYGDPYTIKS